MCYSLTIENRSSMYCIEQVTKKQKIEQYDSQETISEHNIALTEEAILSDMTQPKSPILNKVSNKTLSKFPRTVLGSNVVESKFFNTFQMNIANECIVEDSEREKSPILTPKNRNPFKLKQINSPDVEEVQVENIVLSNSQKENSPIKKSPVLNESLTVRCARSLFGLSGEKVDDVDSLSEDYVIENTYPMETLVTPVDSQVRYIIRRYP